MDVLSLISLLSDGQFHSGSELGEKLGVSRAAVWKALSKLESLGLEVESIKGKGYRLPEALDLIDSECVLSLLSPAAREQVRLTCLYDVDSTNQYLMRQQNVSGNGFDVVIAERQSAGRGRRGRKWVSPFGKNLYLSCMFDLHGGVDKLSGLSLVVGIAVVRAINKCSSADVRLKWPNDVWLDGKKAAGILVELQGEATTGWRVVIGLGVNLFMADAEADAIDQPWVALGSYIECGRNEFAAHVIDCLTDVLAVFVEKGLAAFVVEWQSVDLLYGQSVSVIGTDLVGVAMGIDHQGALLIERGNQLQAINAGEVSVRPHEA